MQIQDLLQLVKHPVEIRLNGFCEWMLNYLMELAEDALDSCADPRDTVAIVMRTAGDQIFTSVHPLPGISTEAVIHPLQESGDTQLTHMVTMLRPKHGKPEWHRGVDLPPYDLRAKLLALNPNNAFTLLVLQGQIGLHARTIGSTMASEAN